MYLGVELLQERLLHSRHHAVQMGLQGVKLLCQEHPAKHKQTHTHPFRYAITIRSPFQLMFS